MSWALGNYLISVYKDKHHSKVVKLELVCLSCTMRGPGPGLKLNDVRFTNYHSSSKL